MKRSDVSIFISYRRSDNPDFVERIRDWFMMRYSAEQVFLDFHNIPPFVNFAEFIREKVAEVEIVVAIIGPEWLQSMRERHINREDDYVRIELGLALELGKVIAPICIKGAKFPRTEALPPDLRDLTQFNAFTLDSGRHFYPDIERVMDSLEQAMGIDPEEEAAAQAAEEEDATRTAEIESFLHTMLNESLPPPERAEAGRNLAELGDPRPGVGLNSDGVPDMDWVEIPAGEFTHPGGTVMHVDAFYMARYPVTHAQFQAFVDDPEGYTHERWWREVADRFDSPQEARWPIANHPRENVSWYEAMAFCHWLTDRLGYQNPILLPTVQQWEKAACGVEGYSFPWGNYYVREHANLDEKYSGMGPYYLQRTTPVGMYPQGSSPFGVMDMSGNVWEWCLSDYHSGETENLGERSARVLKGGSWYDHDKVARNSQRYGDGAGLRSHSVGFRVCVSQPE